MGSHADASVPISRPNAAVVEALLQSVGVTTSIQASLRDIQSSITDDELDNRPFLTVLVRTQGRRIEQLKDALLCLAAQTDQDFEVVIIDHDSDPEGASAVREMVNSQPDSFRRRLSILEVVGGSRSTPLNVGVRAAQGKYVAVFDDDDLLFADWVEQFHMAASHSENRLLRAQTATQQAVSEVWAGGILGQRTLSWPRAEYAKSFDQLAHLVVNHSPFMSWAFPRGLFTHIGLEFDEELDVCEDWDMILRGSLLLGVTDVPALTSIYRRWEGAASSYTVHSSDAWQRSERRVIDRLNGSAIILGPGTVEEIRDMIREDRAQKALALMLRSRSWRLTAPLRVVTNRIHRVKGTFLHHWNRLGGGREGS